MREDIHPGRLHITPRGDEILGKEVPGRIEAHAAVPQEDRKVAAETLGFRQRRHDDEGRLAGEPADEGCEERLRGTVRAAHPDPFIAGADLLQETPQHRVF